MLEKMPKVPSWLLKDLNRGEKVNYAFDALLAAYIVGGLKYGNQSSTVSGVVFLMGLVFIIGCILISQLARKE